MVWDQLDEEGKHRLAGAGAYYKNPNIHFQTQAILGPWIETGIITTDLVPGSCKDHDQRIRSLHMQFIQELDRVIEELENSGCFQQSVVFTIGRWELFDTSPQTWYQNLRDSLIEEQMRYKELQATQEQKRNEAQHLHEQRTSMVRNEKGMDVNESGKLSEMDQNGNGKQMDTVGAVDQTEIVASLQNRFNEQQNRNGWQFFTKLRHFWRKFVYYRSRSSSKHLV